MSEHEVEPVAGGKDQLLKRASSGLLVALSVMFVLAPGVLGVYLYLHGGTDTFFRAPTFHLIVISLAILFSAFVSYIAWASYQQTGKQFQRWLFLGLLGFTVLYAPHGLLTHVALEAGNIWLFILYGPASRLAMAGCFLMAIRRYGRQDGTGQEGSGRGALLLPWAGFYLLLCLLVAALALSPVAGERYVRWTIEGLAIVLMLGCLVQLVRQRLSTHMMWMFAMAIVLFMQSSIAFLFPLAWSHSWWYAHVIFIAGFGLLSYQVALVYLRTGSFESVFNEEEMLENLRQSNASYQQLAHELGRFAHLVSHDLQAPVNKLTMQLSRMKAGEPVDEARVSRMNRILGQMQQTIVSLLRLSEVSDSSLEMRPVDLDELVGSVLDLFREELGRIEAVVRCEPLPVVQGDQALLFDLFQNLVQNAIKYRRERPMLFLIIKAEQKGAFWRISVQDNGRGFSQQDAEVVFQMLGRVHQGAVSGTGAGLAICRKIVERHGGSLTVDAEPDRGAIFFIELPVVPSSA